MSELRELLEYLKTEGNSLAKHAALATLRYTKDEEAIKVAQTILNEKVKVDILELESLVRPDKFEFPEPDIGLVGVKDEEGV